MKKLALILLLYPGVSFAGNLTGFWASSDGGAKVAKQDLYPQGLSSNTITNIWNGGTVSPFGLRNEQIGWNLYLLNASTANATEVSVSMSSFTGTSSGITSVGVSSTNVMNWVDRPVELFYYRYIQHKGMSHLVYDATNEYEARRLPPNFRVPCTISGSQCIPNAPVLYTNRRDANKFIPDPAVPMEFIASSSFTVYAGSSQVVGFDIYIDSNQTVGVYSANITVREGVNVSTVIPVSLTVYNGRLPDRPSMPVIGAYSGYNINYRHQGEHFPSSPNTEPYVTSRKRYAIMAHKHKFMLFGDDNLTGDVPRTEDVQAMSGELFSAATGYYGPGVNTGNSHYMIGTYFSWASVWSTTTLSGSSGFCTHISSWSSYFANNFPNVKANLYLRDESVNFTEHEQFATWLTTACARTNNYLVGSFATGNHPLFKSTAPHINNPASTGIWTSNVTSSTWQTDVESYLTGGTTAAWMYNSNVPGSDQIHQLEADGYGPRQTMWANWLKLSSNGVPKGGHFIWETTYFTDSNNGGQANGNDNDLFHEGKTFGYDGFPSTSAALGRTGFQYTNGDGVLFYPGLDKATTSYYGADGNYGVDVPISSFRAKSLRRGIQDVDYMTLAYAISPSSTTSIVRSVVTKALWETPCQEITDCTYGYGDTPWSKNPDDYEAARLALALIIDANAPAVPESAPMRASGAVNFSGSVTIR